MDKGWTKGWTKLLSSFVHFAAAYRKCLFLVTIWSGKPGSNWRPVPWQNRFLSST